MVEAVDCREFNNVAGFCCSYGTTGRHVSSQGLVCSPRMAVIQSRRLGLWPPDDLKMLKVPGDKGVYASSYLSVLHKV